jgi:4-amino-4-deoxy-L-arabinose transferase
VALIVLGAALLVTAGLLGLFESTETRYAEIAREMLASGDWLAPRLNGILHFHKPPLAYWAAASGMAAFGANAWGARVPVALASIVSLACVARIASRRFASLGAAPGRTIWILGSTLLFAALSRALSTDPFLTAAVLLYWALAPSAWALAALGFGFLAKGPVVFVHTALPVLVAALWGRDRRALALLGPARGWWLCAAVGLPWFLILAARTPGLLSYLLENQIWGRYATTVHQRGGPPWYFVTIALAGAAPWTFALVAGVIRTWRERSSAEARLLLSWLLVPIAFLSFSGSKLPAYILPSFAAAALLAARSAEGRVARWGAAVLLSAGAIAALVAGPAALARLAGVQGAVPLPALALVACALMAVAALAALRMGPETTAALVTAALVALGVAAAPFESQLGSPRRIVELLAQARGPSEPVIEVAHFNAGIPFYLGERVSLLEVPRETGFDERAGAVRVEVPRDSLAALVRAHGRAWLFGQPSLSEEIARDQGLRYTRMAVWRKEALGVVTTP